MTELNKLFNTRYEYLLECSYNSLKLIRRTDLDTTLLADAYEYVVVSEEKIRLKNKNITQSLLESIVVNWMYKQCIWSNTKFKRKFIYADKIDINHSIDIQGDSKVDGMDGQNDGVFKYINSIHSEEEDMLRDEFEHQEKFTFINEYRKSLDLEKALLFEAVYDKGMNTSGKLSSYIGISRTKCWKILTEFKTIINSELVNEYELYKHKRDLL